jgi:hypothetical protein
MTGLVVAGMHRSGTSVTTRLLTAGGWHPGESTLSSETEFYEEDASFVALHRLWLEAYLPPGQGHRDWGISDGGQVPEFDSLPTRVRATLVESAQSFVTTRDAERPRWVAKDPRAALFLPVWAQVDALRFILVYRNPWDMVDSAVRLGADLFCRAPRHVLGAWLDYNLRLERFAVQHRDRCVVVSSESLVADPHAVWEFLQRTVGLDGGPPPELIDSSRYVHRVGDHPMATLHRKVYPHHADLLDRLDALADVPPPVGSRSYQSPVRVLPAGTLAAGTGVQVIIPCRNDGDFIVEAIASVEVCAATRPEVEHVELSIVDDGSNDPETLRVLEVLGSVGYQVTTTDHGGLSTARNTALALSNTGAVIPLDADNRLRPVMLTALESVERGEVDIAHGPWKRFGMQTGVVEPPEMTLDALIPGNAIDACALISRSLLKQLGGWDATLEFWEDWDLWLGAVNVGARVRQLSEVTFDYLVRPGALSGRFQTDPAARDRVVAHVAAKHVDGLGPTAARLLIQVHRLDEARGVADSARMTAEEAYHSLEAAHREVEAAHSAALKRLEGFEGTGQMRSLRSRWRSCLRR